MIYLDNNATTRVREEVLQAMRPFLGEEYGNPSAGYTLGRRTREAVENARAEVAGLVGVHEEEVIFTSGGTEAIATAIRSALACQPGRKHLVTTTVEHSAVEKECARLEAEGVSVTRVGVDSEGLVAAEDVAAAIRPGETALVSVMWANNETGVISPVEEIGRRCEAAGVWFHSDAVQAAGKCDLGGAGKAAAMLAVAGHKMHGPKGVGALTVGGGTRFRPLLVGGGQENERRSGTENVAGIVGMGMAASLLRAELEQGRLAELGRMRDRFEEKVLGGLEGCHVNGHREKRICNTSNLYIEGVDAEALLVLLDERGVCCSPGSACSTGRFEPSRVILAMGYPKERAKRSVRFSFSILNTIEEAEEAANLTVAAARKIRGLRLAGEGPVVVHTER